MKEYRHPSDTTDLSIKQLRYLVDTIPGILRNIPESEFSKKPAPDKWSKKEIIGHLIDSATNNHHRFVRAQFENQPNIIYEQLLWNSHGYYQQMERKHIIAFWEIYNRHIIELIERIPQNQLTKECRISDEETYPLSWIFDDYVRHLEHHLRQIMEIPDART